MARVAKHRPSGNNEPTTTDGQEHTMSEGEKHYHHGRTPAAWTGACIAAVGFVLAAVAFLIGPNWVLFWISMVIVFAGAIAGGVMSRMGLGQA